MYIVLLWCLFEWVGDSIKTSESSSHGERNSLARRGAAAQDVDFNISSKDPFRYLLGGYLAG